jgi:predicted DNA-binding transcriptional regulator AlpA
MRRHTGRCKVLNLFIRRVVNNQAPFFCNMEIDMSNRRSNLHDTKWLAELLGVSVSTIEKRRSQNPLSLPTPIRLGKTVRYDEETVFAWLESCKENY